MLYNDLHAKSIGDQHPSAFGRPAAEAWGDTWSEYKAMAESVMNDGAALAREDGALLPPRRASCPSPRRLTLAPRPSRPR